MRILIALSLSANLYGAASTEFTSGRSTVFSTAANNVTDSALKGWWTFDGPKITWSSATAFTATDDSGNSNSGSQVGTWARSTSGTGGAKGQALTFIASASINCGSGSSLDDLETQGGGGLSVSYWIKPNATVNGGNHLTKGSGAGRWQVYQTTGSTPMQLNFLVDGTTDGTAAFSRAVTLNEWQHFVVTWNASTNFSTGVHCYRNGFELDKTSSANLVARVSDAANSLSLGGVGGGTSIQGGMDDVRVYNRVLSQDEAVQLYRSGSTVYSATPVHVPVTQTVNWFTDFNTGTHGAIPTTASFTLDTHLSGGWTFTNVPNPLVCISYFTNAISIVDPVTVSGGSTYTASSIGIVVDPSVGASSEYLLGTLTSDVDTLSFSLDLMSTIPTSDSANYDIVDVNSADGAEAFVVQLKASAGWRAHATFGGSTVGSDVVYYPGVWYHVTGKWNRNSTSPLYYYIGDELVGISIVNTADKQAHTIQLGNVSDHASSGSGGKIWIANFKVDSDGSTFPIVR